MNKIGVYKFFILTCPMNKQNGIYLVDIASRARNRSPIMVHGTSAEGAIELLSTGTINITHKYREGRYKNHPISNGYLFFLPRKKAFRGHHLHGKILNDFSTRDVEKRVKVYAAYNQEETFLNRLLGYWPPDIFFEEVYNEDYAYNELRESGVDTDKLKQYSLSQLRKEIRRRKGVILGINEKIFELPIEDGIDQPGYEVMIHMPSGLDIKYIKYIRALGELEESTLHEFMQGLPD